MTNNDNDMGRSEEAVVSQEEIEGVCPEEMNFSSSPIKEENNFTAVLDYSDQERGEPASIPLTVCSMLGVILPAGGMLSSGLTLAATSVGAGIVGMPSAFSSVGIIMGTLYLILISAETAFSMALLAGVCERTGLRTFEELARNLVHRNGHIYVALIRILHTLGGTVAYVVIIRDLVKPILDAIGSVPSFYTSYVGLRIIQALLFCLFMMPLVIPRYISSMRYVSAVGISFILYLSVVIIVHSCQNGLQEDSRPQTSLVKTGNGALEGLGVFIFSFMCQINCLEIFFEMTNRSVKRFALCAWITMCLCGALYIVTGLFGYLDFGTLSGSILLQYNPIEQPAILVCYIGVFVKLCASFSLVSYACRTAVFSLLGWNLQTVPFRKHLLVSLSMALINLMLGLFIPQINLVLSFFGGFCGGQVGFILPAIFSMYEGGWTRKSVGTPKFLLTYIILFAGILSVVVGTGSTIYSVAS